MTDFLPFSVNRSENDITYAGLENSFVDEYDYFGSLQAKELMPNGDQIRVTEQNKLDYIRLLCEHRLKGRVESQLKSFVRGLHEIIPKEALAIFDERELEVSRFSLLFSYSFRFYSQMLTLFSSFKLLIGGISEISVEDWQKHTDYRGYKSTDQEIVWFWKAVKSWPVEKRSRLLQFTTGTSRTPVGGFRDLAGSDGPRRFTIEKAGQVDALPKTHTCFNRLDLPPYKSIEM